MSSTGRTTSKGGKGAKPEKPGTKVDKAKTDGGKGGGEKSHTKEHVNLKTDETSIKETVKQLIDLTQRSEEEVCLALHESNNDANLAINILYEEMAPGEWETRDKKKKKRQASASKQDKAEEGATVDDWDSTAPSGNTNIAAGGDKDKGRNSKRGDGGPRRNDGNRGWRGRERHENERNFEDGGGGRGGDRDRRGRSGGLTRGGGGGRGRGGGRAGGRYPPRGDRRDGRPPRNDYNKQPIDTWDSSNTWDNNTAANITNHNNTDDWNDDFPGADEWSTEDFSLVESKVFTPSVPPKMDVFNSETIQQQTQPQQQQGLVDQNNVINQETSYSQQLSQSLQMAPQSVQMPAQSPVPPIVGTLTAAQSQYFNQLSQQNSDSLSSQYNNSYTNQTYDKSNVQQVYSNTSSQLYNSTSTQPVYNSTSQQPTYNSQPYSADPPANSYTNNTYQQQVNSNAYGQSPETQSSNQPARTKTQRARVPPPSKIPSSAVEMPGGDLNSSITYLDVQFGAMDLIDNSFDSGNQDNKFGSATTNSSAVSSVLDTSSNAPNAGVMDLGGATSANQNSTGLDAYAKSNVQNSISSSLSQSLQSNDSIPQTSEHLSYNSAASVASSRSTAQSGSGTGGVVTSVASSAPSGLDLGKQQTDSHSYNAQAPTYNSYQSKTNSYSTSPYNTAQTSATNSYGLNSQPTYVNNQSSSYNTSSSYPNTYSTPSYQTGTNSAFPSISQPSSYQPTGQSSYPQNTSQSVYGAGTGLNPNFGNNTSTSQYNSYNSSSSNNLKNSYDNSSSGAGGVTSISTAQSTTSSSAVVSTSSLSLSSQSTVSNSKTTTSLAKSSSVVSNIPPGVAPVMSTPYIMGQVPYFQQPVYSYEEMQLLQQRLPHMTTPYYDMNYQTPTTLAPVRGDPTGALGGYSTMSADGRFTTGTSQRGDSNTSPVPSSTLTGAVQSQTSTLSAQQGHQAQPILAAGTAPPYFFTAFNTIAAAPNYAQFGAMYTLPAATNAHGSSNSSQYPKPATYGSASAGYSHYDALAQSTQDYSKSGFAVSNAAVAAAAQAQKVQGTNSTSGTSSNDLTAMYGKTHAALGKVNSYDKQGFHSGTPPPFNAGLHGNQTAALQNATGYTPMYIPTMPAPQHHTTTMMHQPLHQMDVRHQGRRVDSGSSTGQRSQGSNQAKSGSKQPYQSSYWNQN